MHTTWLGTGVRTMVPQLSITTISNSVMALLRNMNFFTEDAFLLHVQVCTTKEHNLAFLDHTEVLTVDAGCRQGQLIHNSA